MKKLITLIIILQNILICSAQTITNGSMTAGGNSINSAPPGWIKCGFSPDVLNLGYPSYSSTSQVGAINSPDGGTWVGLASISSFNLYECVSTTVTGLTIGNSYTLQFYGACFGTGTIWANQDPSNLTISVGATSQLYIIPMAASTWNTYTLNFTATASTMVLTASNLSGNTYASLDGFMFINPLLPIELSSFEAVCNNNVLEIEWTSLSEINNDYFTIERSSDAVNYEALGRVNGNGNSNTIINYTWIDDNPLSGTAYYRLKQTDFNGAFEYLGVKSATCVQGGNISIYPNPFENNFTVQLSENTTYPNTVEVIDYLGRIVYSKTIETNLTVIAIDELSLGTYFVKVHNETMHVVERIVKMK